MELWIRSQDKKRLGQIIFIEYRKDDYGYHLTGWRDKFEGTRLATYKTEERALEVLDEIQSKIVENKCLEVMLPKVTDVRGYEEQYGKMFKETIYQMPKE